MTNLCRNAGLCCPHRSSKCVVQYNYTKPCYCDKSCRFFKDCWLDLAAALQGLVTAETPLRR